MLHRLRRAGRDRVEEGALPRRQVPEVANLRLALIGLHRHAVRADGVMRAREAVVHEDPLLTAEGGGVVVEDAQEFLGALAGAARPAGWVG